MIEILRPGRHRAQRRRPYLRDAVLGAVDGVITTFAVVAGVAGAGLPTDVIVIIGLVNAFADGVSMAAGDWLGVSSDSDNALAAKPRISDGPKVRRLGVILRSARVSEVQLDAIVQQIDALYAEGARGPEERALSPWVAALVTFATFVLAGMVPLLPFILELSHAYILSVCATVLVFLVIGLTRSACSEKSGWRATGETLLLGGAAALVAYAVGTQMA